MSEGDHGRNGASFFSTSLVLYLRAYKYPGRVVCGVFLELREGKQEAHKHKRGYVESSGSNATLGKQVRLPLLPMLVAPLRSSVVNLFGVMLVVIDRLLSFFFPPLDPNQVWPVLVRGWCQKTLRRHFRQATQR